MSMPTIVTRLTNSRLVGGTLTVVPRRFFVKKIRPFEERMRQTIKMHKQNRLELVRRQPDKPDRYILPKLPPNPTIVTKERKLPSPKEAVLPYHKYSDETVKSLQNFETFYDPLFNPHLLEQRHEVNPDEEPFNAIYSNNSNSNNNVDKSEAANDYTEVRNITSPELWSYVEQLARIKVAPEPRRRKANEPIKPLPSGFVPPPETPPDLPYFVARTRNHLLPVYYCLHSDPNECKTLIKQVTGDMWKLEEDLRTHLEALVYDNKRRILSSVQEPDERIEFRGKYLHHVVDWLHAQGF